MNIANITKAQNAIGRACDQIETAIEILEAEGIKPTSLHSARDHVFNAGNRLDAHRKTAIAESEAEKKRVADEAKAAEEAAQLAKLEAEKNKTAE